MKSHTVDDMLCFLIRDSLYTVKEISDSYKQPN